MQYEQRIRRKVRPQNRPFPTLPMIFRTRRESSSLRYRSLLFRRPSATVLCGDEARDGSIPIRLQQDALMSRALPKECGNDQNQIDDDGGNGRKHN